MSHEVEVESSSRQAFDLAMQLAFLSHPEATHFLFDKEAGCLVVFWHDPNPEWHAEKLRKPMDWRDVADYAWEWVVRELKSQKRPATYADGLSGAFHLKAGGEFRLHWRNGYEPKHGSPYGIVAIWPEWAEVHK